MNLPLKLCLVSIALTAAVGKSSFGLAQAPAHVDSWEPAIEGKHTFDVATIKPSDANDTFHPNIGLSIENGPAPQGGRFLARGTLPQFIEFAYRIALTRDQQNKMVASLPKWVGAQFFAIEAKTDAVSATKEQMRLMTRSLLADRFALKLHFETKTQPALAIVLAKEGEVGPRLRHHSEGLPCDAKWSRPEDVFSSSVPPGGFLPACGLTALMVGPHNAYLLGGRNFTMPEIAEHIPMWQNYGLPVVDQTGLTGTYDFSLYSTPDVYDPTAPGDNSQPDSGVPTFTEALKEQFGIKLKSIKAPVRFIVIDHVEQPSVN